MVVAILNNGCVRRTTEASKITFWFRKNGILVTSLDNSPDAVIFVSCIYNEAKETHTRATLKKLNDLGKKVYLVGCFKDAFPTETYPNITAFPLKEYAQHLDAEFNLTYKLADIKDHEVSNTLSIATGCIWNCAYCAIVKGVGNLKSKPLLEIESEINKYTEKQDLLLMGEDTGIWGMDLDEPFSKLVELLLASKPNILFDNMSAYAFMKNYASFEALSNAKKLRSIVVGVQHFNNDVLKAMNRPLLDFDLFKERILNLIGKGVNIHFYLMSGFPAETQEYAEEQLREVIYYTKHKVLFSIFNFHRKEGTNILFPDIDTKEKQLRVARLLSIRN